MPGPPEALAGPHPGIPGSFGTVSRASSQSALLSMQMWGRRAGARAGCRGCRRAPPPCRRRASPSAGWSRSACRSSGCGARPVRCSSGSAPRRPASAAGRCRRTGWRHAPCPCPCGSGCSGRGRSGRTPPPPRTAPPRRGTRPRASRSWSRSLALPSCPAPAPPYTNRVMPGLVPGISRRVRTPPEMAGSSPAMTRKVRPPHWIAGSGRMSPTMTRRCESTGAGAGDANGASHPEAARRRDVASPHAPVWTSRSRPAAARCGRRAAGRRR